MQSFWPSSRTIAHLDSPENNARLTFFLFCRIFNSFMHELMSWFKLKKPLSENVFRRFNWSVQGIEYHLEKVVAFGVVPFSHFLTLRSTDDTFFPIICSRVYPLSPLTHNHLSHNGITECGPFLHLTLGRRSLLVVFVWFSIRHSSGFAFPVKGLSGYNGLMWDFTSAH